MHTATAGQLQYLKLDSLVADPKLARCLPPDLAWRYHALPLVEDDGRVTVVMADPNDVEAREAVVSVLGPRACVLQASPLAIDVRLAEIWGENLRCPPELRVRAFSESLPDRLRDYTKVLGSLLGAHLDQPGLSEAADKPATEEAWAPCDLAVFGNCRHPLIRSMLSPAPGARARAPGQGLFPSAVLVAEQPRWP